MLTLDAVLRIPDSVMFTPVRGDVVLLNTLSNKYYALDDVGARFWQILAEGVNLKGAYEALLSEYEVEPALLEHDLLELLDHLVENRLVEIVKA